MEELGICSEDFLLKENDCLEQEHELGQFGAVLQCIGHDLDHFLSDGSFAEENEHHEGVHEPHLGAVVETIPGAFNETKKFVAGNQGHLWVGKDLSQI